MSVGLYINEKCHNIHTMYNSVSIATFLLLCQIHFECAWHTSFFTVYEFSLRLTNIIALVEATEFSTEETLMYLKEDTLVILACTLLLTQHVHHA